MAATVPEAWVGREAHLRYVDADAPRSLDCTISEVNNRGVCVDTGDETSFFPWNSVVRQLIREVWTRYRWEGRPRRKP